MRRSENISWLLLIRIGQVVISPNRLRSETSHWPPAPPANWPHRSAGQRSSAQILRPHLHSTARDTLAGSCPRLHYLRACPQSGRPKRWWQEKDCCPRCSALLDFETAPVE